MSANLYWEPVKPSKGKSLSDALKFLLREHRRLDEGDVVLDRSDVPWLQGVIAGTNSKELKEDVEELLGALEKYESLRLWQQW